MNIMKASEDDIFKLGPLMTKAIIPISPPRKGMIKMLLTCPPEKEPVYFPWLQLCTWRKFEQFCHMLGLAGVHNSHVSKSFNFQPILQNKQ